MMIPASQTTSQDRSPCRNESAITSVHEQTFTPDELTSLGVRPEYKHHAATRCDVLPIGVGKAHHSFVSWPGRQVDAKAPKDSEESINVMLLLVVLDILQETFVHSRKVYFE